MPTLARGNAKSLRPSRPAAAKINQPLDRRPTRLTYALKQWSVERRDGGWFVSPTTSSVVGNKPEWRGPFATIETACLAIARSLAVEIADRHTRHIEFHKLDARHPLHGLKPDTRLKPRGNGSVT